MRRKSWRKDITGERYNMLTCMGFSHLGSWQRQIWDWLCDCGNTTKATKYNVTRGHTKSCGCLQKRKAKELCEGRHLGDGIAELNSQYASYRGAARRKNREFVLSYLVFEALVKSDCYYCGNPPKDLKKISTKSDNRKERVGLISNGIDRINPSKGYYLENVVPCCWRCNTAKNDMDSSEFEDLITNIYNNWVAK